MLRYEQKVCLYRVSPVEQTAVGIIALVYDRPRGGPKSDVVECTSRRHGVVLA